MSAFESKACFRCCGTGHYGPTSVYGGRCFGCGGSGQKLAERGAAAIAWLVAQQQIAVEHLACGDVIEVIEPTYSGGVVNRQARVIAVDVDQDGAVRVTAEYLDRKTGGIGAGITQTCLHTGAGATERVLRDSDRTKQLVAAALAYQETLTQTGSVRKVRTKKVAAQVSA